MAGRFPSRRIAGHMFVSGRFSGAIEFGWFGRGSNHITPLFISTPERGSTTRLPSTRAAST